MPISAHDNSAVQPDQDFSVAEIFAIRGVNTNENPLSLSTEEMTVFRNFILGPRHIIRRKGAVAVGSEAGSGAISKIVGMGHLEQDSGITLLMLGNNGDLYKYTGGTWSVSDKTDYDVTQDAQIVTFSSKNGSSVETGTSSGGTTKYLIEDASKTWTPGAYKGKCVVIKGETKFILDNTVTTLFLSDRLNLDTDASYQTQTYTIYDLDPVAFIANGVDQVQKYNLTTHTPLDGTHVSGGEAIPKFRYITPHQGRLWGMRGLGDDNDRVFISDVAIGEQFTKDTNLNINLSFLNDGDEITGGVSLPLRDGSVLLVTKNESVHSVEGSTVLDYAVHARFARSGCIAPKTLRVAGRSAFMLGFDGILRFSGDGGSDLLDRPIPISEPIAAELKALSEAELRNACAEVWDNKYLIHAGDTLYLYDIIESIRREQHIWSTVGFGGADSWKFNQLHRAGGNLYAGGKENGIVYQLFTGNTDAGERITANLTTAWVTGPGAPSTYMDRVEIMADKNAAAVLRIAVAVDGGDFGSYITATLDSDLGIYRFPIKTRATSFKFKLIDNYTGDAVKIAMPIRLFYSVDAFGQRDTKGSLAS